MSMQKQYLIFNIYKMSEMHCFGVVVSQAWTNLQGSTRPQRDICHLTIDHQVEPLLSLMWMFAIRM